MSKKEKVKKPFYKRIWVWVIAIIVIIAVASGSGDDNEAETASGTADGSDKTEEKSDEVSEEEDDEVTEVKVGQPAEVADVTFTVNDVEETTTIESGNEFIDNAETSGKFVILDMTVENGKDESFMIDSNFFTIITKDGTEYDSISSGDAFMALGDSATDFLLEKINPNLDKSGKVVFEVGGDVEVSESVLEAQTGFFGTEKIEISLSE